MDVEIFEQMVEADGVFAWLLKFHVKYNPVLESWRAGERAHDTMLYLLTGASPRITDAGPHREDSYISDDFIIH